MLLNLYTLFLTLSTISCTASLSCFTCSGANSLSECSKSIEKCSEGQVCYKKREYTTQIQLSLGCIDKMRCGEYAQVQNTSEVSKMNVEQSSYCHECCSTDKCNDGLCIYPSNTMCKDDVSTDCAKLNSMFSICKVTTQAKKICPRYCNLCNLVDGNWSPWSPWSSCDVTCGIGSKVRHRTCTNPAPQNGGLHCQGRGSQNKFCHLQKCPVHGGWSSWGRWGTCSATCGIGIRRRVRSCTNPRPLRFGDHCFGDRHEAELCERISCTNKIKSVLI